LTKKDDPGMPSIYCSINGYNFYKTFCDTGSGVNIMAAVTYRLLFRTMPLKPTYIQLQMADQTFQEVKSTVTDVPVKIDDHFVYTDFQVIDMGEDEYDPLVILGRPFLSTVKAIIYIGIGEVHMHFPLEKRRQIIKDGWVDYEGEVIRSEDIQFKQNNSEETVAPSQVWREKIAIHEEEVPPEAPTTPLNESQDD